MVAALSIFIDGIFRGGFPDSRTKEPPSVSWTPGGIERMSYLLQHPVKNGISFEFLLVAAFLFFSVGPCKAPAVGVAVVYLHYPAGIFVERVLGISYSGMQLLLSSFLMVPVWILLLFFSRSVVNFRQRDSSPGPDAKPL